MGRLIRNSALLFIMVIFTGFFIYWANQVELDEMTRIQGVVMPSSKEKVIQSEFNGRLTEIKVKLGDRLAAGDLIARVSDEEMVAEALRLAEAEGLVRSGELVGVLAGNDSRARATNVLRIERVP